MFGGFPFAGAPFAGAFGVVSGIAGVTFGYAMRAALGQGYTVGVVGAVGRAVARAAGEGTTVAAVESTGRAVGVFGAQGYAKRSGT